MDGFKSPLVGHWMYKGRKEVFILDEPFEYHVGYEESDDVVQVPLGFVTDFASVPRLLWWMIPPTGVHGKAAVIHDWLYKSQTRSQKEADLIFLEAMERLHVVKWKREAMYRFVRTFGWWSWRNHKRRNEKN